MARGALGIRAVDLRMGDAVHCLRIEGVMEELYDVIPLPAVGRRMALGFVTNEICRVIKHRRMRK